MLNIIILGAPGSGKGTHSELIIEKYGLCHISTGEILRQEIEAQTPLGLIADEYISKGYLAPDQLVIDMLADILDKNKGVKGYLFDGFPRTLVQGEALDVILRERETSIAAVLCFTLEREVLVNRLLKRGERDGRQDDRLEVINNRLEVYATQTEPLRDYYKKKGKLFNINSSGTIEEVFENIMETLDHLNLG